MPRHELREKTSTLGTLWSTKGGLATGRLPPQRPQGGLKGQLGKRLDGFITGNGDHSKEGDQERKGERQETGEVREPRIYGTETLFHLPHEGKGGREYLGSGGEKAKNTKDQSKNEGENYIQRRGSAV